MTGMTLNGNFWGVYGRNPGGGRIEGMCLISQLQQQQKYSVNQTRDKPR